MFLKQKKREMLNEDGLTLNWEKNSNVWIGNWAKVLVNLDLAQLLYMRCSSVRNSLSLFLIQLHYCICFAYKVLETKSSRK